MATLQILAMVVGSGTRYLRQVFRHASFSSSSSSTFSSLPLKFSPEVQHALDHSLPLVALESTIISHGMPYPQNRQVAIEVEEIVRNHQCTPATIAIIDGECCIGLDEGQLERIADPNTMTLKASKRDIAFVCAQQLDAATTVASTMALAHLAGIRVFCTGGIGGVHRGAESTFDVSADLEELACTPVAVVCAGIKSILDIPKSLEVLETNGVPVVTFQSNSFPSFFTNNSGISSPMVMQSESAIAKMMHLSSSFNFLNGMVVAVPNPAPADSGIINAAIEEALVNADRDRIDGARLTPYILAAIEKSTGGKSLDANVALVKNNAKVASNIAKELSKITEGPANSLWKRKNNVYHTKVSSSTSAFEGDALWSIDNNARNENDVLIFGGAVVDNVSTCTEHMILNSSNPGKLISTVGGVGRNIAIALAKLEGNYTLGMITCIGRDDAGAKVLRDLSSNRIDTSKTKIKCGLTTATYNAVHEGTSGNLVVAVADMHIFNEIDAVYINNMQGHIEKARIVIADGNLSVDAFRALGNICNRNGIPFYFEPTSDHKCLLPLRVKPSSSSIWTNGIQLVDLLKPNLSELIVMVKYILNSSERDLLLPNRGDFSDVHEILMRGEDDGNAVDIQDIGKLAGILYQAMCVNYGESPLTRVKAETKKIIVSLGDRGCLLVHTLKQPGGTESVRKEHFPVSADFLGTGTTIVNTSGAGDCLFAGVIHQLVDETVNIDKIHKAIEYGLRVSEQSMTSTSAVPERFCIRQLKLEDENERM